MKGSRTALAPELLSNIRNRIKSRSAIVGIGNPLKGDDGFGPRLVEMLRAERVKADIFDCGTAPENYIFPILAISWETIILIDTADLGADPGDIKVINIDEISNASFSTHNPSPRLFADLLKMGRDGLNIFAISIQPKTIAFGKPMSEEIKSGLVLLKDIFKKIFG